MPSSTSHHMFPLTLYSFGFKSKAYCYCAFNLIFLPIYTAVKEKKLISPQGPAQLHLVLFKTFSQCCVLCATVIRRECTHRSLIWRPAGKQCPLSSVMSLLLRSRVSTEASSLVRLPSMLRILLWCLENKEKTHKKALGVAENPPHRATTLPYRHHLENILPCSPKEDTRNPPRLL